MPTLALLTPGARASLVSERIHVEFPPPRPGEGDRPARDIPLHDVELVFLSDAAHLTTPALAELLHRRVPTVVIDQTDRVLGLCQPPAPHAVTRLSHYRRALDPAFALAVASGIVEAKILNSRRVLQRLGRSRPDTGWETAVLSLNETARRCLDAASLETLRGYEGTAAGRYFEALGSFFPPHAPFERRSRRPPHNAANAILSFTYALLTAEVEVQLHAAGLDPALGFLHEPDEGRPSLALDMVEPLRAPVGDALALDALAHQILRPDEHFDARDGGTFLNRSGRHAFFGLYERRMDREFTSEQHGARSTLRGEIARQVASLKASIASGAAFEPFLMN